MELWIVVVAVVVVTFTLRLPMAFADLLAVACGRAVGSLTAY